LENKVLDNFTQVGRKVRDCDSDIFCVLNVVH